MTDTEILDWLQAEFEEHGQVDFRRYGPGCVGVELFSVGCQHVRASGNGSIRKVVEVAKRVSETRAAEKQQFQK